MPRALSAIRLAKITRAAATSVAIRRSTRTPLSSGRRALADDMRARRLWLRRAMADALTEAERGALLTACEAMLKLALYEAPAKS